MEVGRSGPSPTEGRETPEHPRWSTVRWTDWHTCWQTHRPTQTHRPITWPMHRQTLRFTHTFTHPCTHGNTHTHIYTDTESRHTCSEWQTWRPFWFDRCVHTTRQTDYLHCVYTQTQTHSNMYTESDRPSIIFSGQSFAAVCFIRRSRATSSETECVYLMCVFYCLTLFVCLYIFFCWGLSWNV